MLVSVCSKAEPRTKLTRLRLGWALLAGCKCWYCALFACIEGSFCVSFIFSLHKTGHSFRAELVNSNAQNPHRATSLNNNPPARNPSGLWMISQGGDNKRYRPSWKNQLSVWHLHLVRMRYSRMTIRAPSVAYFFQPYRVSCVIPDSKSEARDLFMDVTKERCFQKLCVVQPDPYRRSDLTCSRTLPWQNNSMTKLCIDIIVLG